MHVNVLCPSGHRHMIKVNPNTTLLQVLEQACIKQGLDPADFELRKEDSKSRPFDLTLTFRFAGLINNVHLQLVRSDRRRETNLPVVVALQLPSGERLQNSFIPTTSLWDVLQQFEKDGAQVLSSEQGKTTVVIYMREEVFGANALNSTSLKALGIVSGRAILRVMYRENTNMDIGRETEVSENKQQVQSKPETEPHEQIPQSQVPDIMEARNIPIRYDSSEQMEAMAIYPALNAEQREFMMNMSKFIGAQWSEENRDCGSSSANRSTKASSSDKPSTRSIPGSQMSNEFANFKFPEQTVDRRDDKSSGLSYEGGDVPSGERGTVVYKLPTNEQRDRLYKNRDDVPEDFFDVTLTDVKKMINHLASERMRLENAPLITRAQQQTKIDAEMNKYKYSLLRLKLPGDEYVVEAKFNSLEKVVEVVKFVKTLLKEDIDFHLYVAPPKQVLKSDETLFSYRLFPKAVVYVGVSETRPNYLTDAVRASAINLGEERESTKSDSSNVVGPVPSCSDTQAASSTANNQKMQAPGTGTNESPARSNNAAASADKAEAKAPKWFKIGK